MRVRSRCEKQVVLFVLPSSLQYKPHRIPTLKRFLYCLTAAFVESLEARYQVEYEDVVGAAPTGDAPTTSEWSTILLPTKVHLILEILRYFVMHMNGVMSCYMIIAILYFIEHFI